jgi:hypothetical protein
MQGWRISMEDSHTAILDLLEGNPKASKDHAAKLSFFGVYDGHGGDKVALFAGDNIYRIVSKQETFKTGNYEQALKDGFLATDRAILAGMITPVFPGRGDGARVFCDRPAATGYPCSTRPVPLIRMFSQIPSTKRRFRAVLRV